MDVSPIGDTGSIQAVLWPNLDCSQTAPISKGSSTALFVKEGKLPMVISKTVIVATVLIQPMMFCFAQTTASSTTGASGNTSASYFTPAAPSDILQRSIQELQQTAASVKLDKWKRGSVREEAGTNIDAIQRDLQGTFPSLLKDADAAPGTLSKVLPLARNVDALYDVLLHVVEGSRVSAPGDQVGMLQQTMADLEKARIALDNQIQQTATAQEKQIVELRATVQKQDVSLKAAATPPTAPKCPVAPTPAKRKRKPSTTTSKPAAGTPTNQPKTQ